MMDISPIVHPYADLSKSVPRYQSKSRRRTGEKAENGKCKKYV